MLHNSTEQRAVLERQKVLHNVTEVSIRSESVLDSGTEDTAETATEEEKEKFFHHDDDLIGLIRFFPLFRPARKIWLLLSVVSVSPSLAGRFSATSLNSLLKISHQISRQISHQFSHRISHRFSHQISHQISRQISHRISRQISHQISRHISRRRRQILKIESES